MGPDRPVSSTWFDTSKWRNSSTRESHLCMSLIFDFESRWEEIICLVCVGIPTQRSLLSPSPPLSPAHLHRSLRSFRCLFSSGPQSWPQRPLSSPLWATTTVVFGAVFLWARHSSPSVDIIWVLLKNILLTCQVLHVRLYFFLVINWSHTQGLTYKIQIEVKVAAEKRSENAARKTLICISSWWVHEMPSTADLAQPTSINRAFSLRYEQRFTLRMKGLSDGDGSYCTFLKSYVVIWLHTTSNYLATLQQNTSGPSAVIIWQARHWVSGYELGWWQLKMCTRKLRCPAGGHTGCGCPRGTPRSRIGAPRESKGRLRYHESMRWPRILQKNYYLLVFLRFHLS